MSEDIIDVPTAEEIAQSYTAMGHSVELINGIIDGTQMADETDEDKKDCVKRNGEDMTSVNSAIASATTYLG